MRGLSPDRNTLFDGKACCDGVLQQLGHDDGERRRHLGRDVAELTVDPHGERVAVLVGLLHHPHEGVDDLVEGHLVARLAGEDLVHDGDRPDPALCLGQGYSAFGGIDAASLQAQQRGDRLEVVLHPMMDFPDRGVLCEKETVPPAHVGHVPDEDKAAGHLASGQEGDGPQQQGGVGTSLDLLHDGQAFREGLPDGGGVEPEGRERRSVDGTDDADAVEGAHRVRRREGDPAQPVDDEDAVTDAWGVLNGQLVVGEGKQPVVHHDRETLEQGEVDALERASPPLHGRRPYPAHHPE